MNFKKTLSVLLAVVLSALLLTPDISKSYALEDDWKEVSAVDCTSGISLTTGNYILTESILLTNSIVIPEGECVCIDLASFDLSVDIVAQDCAIKNFGTLYIMDSVAIVADGEYRSCGSVSSLELFGTEEMDSSFSLLGGKLDALLMDGNSCRVNILSGCLGFDPRNVVTVFGSALAECSCVSLEASSGIYTVTHKSAEPCALCNNAFLSDGFNYTLIGGHVYETGDVCTNCEVISAKINDVGYTELLRALNDANADSVITLQRDIEVEVLDLYTTIDLNGHSISAVGIIDAANADAHIVDNLGGGTVSGSSIKMYKDNSQLAIDAENNNVYSFESIALKQKVTKVDSNTSTIKFYIDKASKDTKLDDSVRAGANIKVRLTVSWVENGQKKSHSFVYAQDLVEAYVKGWDNRIFTCSITGLNELSNYTITANIISCDVIVNGDEVRKLLTWKEYLALSSAEQRAYKESFENREDYYAWLKEAREAYDKEQETEMDGNIDIGDILKP